MRIETTVNVSLGQASTMAPTAIVTMPTNMSAGHVRVSASPDMSTSISVVCVSLFSQSVVADGA